ncbi:hypothetical protein AHAS_Ahas04G0225800 [Arachis hypogaea]
MERKLHAPHSTVALRETRITLLNGALFHFSKPFEENTNRPFSSNIPNCRYTTRHEDLKSPSTQHRKLHQQSPEKNEVIILKVILFFLVVLGITVLVVLVLLITDFWEYIA